MCDNQRDLRKTNVVTAQCRLLGPGWKFEPESAVRHLNCERLFPTGAALIVSV